MSINIADTFEEEPFKVCSSSSLNDFGAHP